jgi:hypothetical protein
MFLVDAGFPKLLLGQNRDNPTVLIYKGEYRFSLESKRIR